MVDHLSPLFVELSESEKAKAITQHIVHPDSGEPLTNEKGSKRSIMMFCVPGVFCIVSHRTHATKCVRWFIQNHAGNDNRPVVKRIIAADGKVASVEDRQLDPTTPESHPQAQFLCEGGFWTIALDYKEGAQSDVQYVLTHGCIFAVPKDVCKDWSAHDFLTEIGPDDTKYRIASKEFREGPQCFP